MKMQTQPHNKTLCNKNNYLIGGLEGGKKNNPSLLSRSYVSPSSFREPNLCLFLSSWLVWQEHQKSIKRSLTSRQQISFYLISTILFSHYKLLMNISYH